MELQASFENFIRKRNLFSKKKKILLAVSGGLDSIVMAELFYRGGYRFGIAHCNFKLRGKDSDKDEQFVRQLAQKYQVEFFSVEFDTKKYSKEHKLSIQEAARNLRHDWFRETAYEKKYNCVATAHHYNDSAETFFINLLRGTGIAGLSGITPESEDLWIARPLLFARRTELETFARQENLKFREDRSNHADDYLRNRIRHHLIPMLIQLKPDFEKVMQRNLENIQFARNIFERSVLNKIISLWFNAPGKKLDREKIGMEEYPAELFTEFARGFGFNASQAADIWNSRKNGAQVFSEKYIITADRSGFIVSEHGQQPVAETKIKKSQKQFSKDRVALRFSFITGGLEKVSLSGKHPLHLLSSRKLKFPLTLRKWEAGDAFQPLGMKGRKKISDFLVDKKVSRPDKEKTYVLLSGKTIVCLLGHRIDERFKVTGKTKEIYKIEFLRNE